MLKEIMEQDGKKVLITHYADLLKYECKTFFDWNGIKDDEGRTILQHVGTDVIRKQNPNYWVNFLCEFLSMFQDEWDYVLIPDCRFQNEITKMQTWFDTYSLRINRIDFESNLTEDQKNHISETALDDYDFDYVINTVSDLNVLRQSLVDLYNEELKGE
jgi:hypothetical protein